MRNCNTTRAVHKPTPIKVGNKTPETFPLISPHPFRVTGLAHLVESSASGKTH